MAKVYLVEDSFWVEDGSEQSIVGVFENKADAEKLVAETLRLAKICQSGHRYRVVEKAIETSPRTDTYPEKLRFVAILDLDNTYKRIHLRPLEEEDGPKNGFVPMKDNCFSTHSKGEFVGCIEFDPTKTREWHQQKAREIIDKVGTPDWVLRSIDGHDKDHPQGI